MKIYITGVSGTGKTTLAKELNKKGIATYSIDEVDGLCYWVNKTDGHIVNYEATLNKEFIDSHKWVCDVEQLKKLINTADPIIILGLAENQEEFINLFNKVLLLQCPPEVFLQRIMERKDNDFGKDPSAQEFIKSSYQEFETKLLEHGAISIDANRPINDVLQSILSFLPLK